MRQTMTSGTPGADGGTTKWRNTRHPNNDNDAATWLPRDSAVTISNQSTAQRPILNQPRGDIAQWTSRAMAGVVVGRSRRLSYPAKRRSFSARHTAIIE